MLQWVLHYTRKTLPNKATFVYQRRLFYHALFREISNSQHVYSAKLWYQSMPQGLQSIVMNQRNVRLWNLKLQMEFVTFSSWNLNRIYASCLIKLLKRSAFSLHDKQFFIKIINLYFNITLIRGYTGLTETRIPSPTDNVQETILNLTFRDILWVAQRAA